MLKKKTGIDIKKKLWNAANKLRNQMDAAEYKHIVLGLIFLKYISDSFEEQRKKILKLLTDKNSETFVTKDIKQASKYLEDRDYYTQDNIFWVPINSRWEIIRDSAKQPDIGEIIDNALSEIEKENKSLSGKLDKRFGRTQLSEGRMGKLIDLISTINFEQRSASDILGEVYEYFLGEFALAEGKKGGQFYTPPSIVQILVEVLAPHKGRVYDPCCGSGGMFVQSEKFIKSHGGKVDDISIYGQESNPTTWKLAAMNMAIRGFAADLGKIADDTFGNDQFRDYKFDYILANPHFNDSDWGGEKYENDVRWKYGRPSVGNANYAWLQHIIWKLGPRGRAGVILSNGSLNAEDNIRKNMVKDNIIEAIISLPGNLFTNTPIPSCLWFLSKAKEKNNKGEILFIDARKMGTMKTKKNKIFTNEDIQKISKIVHSWRQTKNYQDVEGFCKSCDLDLIKNNNFNLNPGRYVEQINTQEDKFTFKDKLLELKNKFKNLESEIKEIENDINQNFKFLEKK